MLVFTLLKAIYCRYSDYADIVKYICETFDDVYGGYWQCIVGPCGYRIWQANPHYIVLKWGNNKIILFKTN